MAPPPKADWGPPRTGRAPLRSGRTHRTQGRIEHRARPVVHERASRQVPGSTSGTPVATPDSVIDSPRSTDMPRVTVGTSPPKSKP